MHPRTPAEVSLVLKTVRETRSKFAVRGAGHNCNRNVAGVDAGVVIDTRELNAVSFDKASGVAKVGAGCRWGQVYAVLEEHGVTVTGGRQRDVGVGGYLLGGLFGRVLYSAW